ncbi:glutathione S-transferase [Aureimonas endophytica]|uniref:Glutathione S-transferase n=1 Tax=Aureimonas endophytica TaxID=2027858 RepID=A0A916ZHX7_9HYPH|nr:glutathione S-transferase N-terminal domain-containing protein [Aureimonas endophytica]GGD98802.1 glutathione S-transferase [Aureimonas endophytica]
MRLLTGPTTPFGRMVEVAALEAGIALDIEVIAVTGAAFLDALNPLRLIPTLVAADGTAVYDSRVICRVLAEERPQAGLFPAGFDRAFETRLALVCGIMDAGVARQGEVTRLEAARSPEVIARLEARLWRGFARLEAEIDRFDGAFPRLDALGAAVLLDYVDFRVCRDWRAEAPRLAAFLAREGERPSMVATRFPRAA